MENKFVFCTELNNRRKPFYDDKNLQQSEDEEEDEIENSWILLEEPEVIKIIIVNLLSKSRFTLDRTMPPMILKKNIVELTW